MNRHGKDEGGPRKRTKLSDPVHSHFYPPINADDDVSFERNLSLLKEESEKAKPQSDVLKELMRRTFPNRWDAYASRNDPPTLLDYLRQYPLLRKASYVCFYVHCSMRRHKNAIYYNDCTGCSRFFTGMPG